MMDAPTLHVNDLHTSLWQGTIDLGDGETLSITITHEGIIMDHDAGHPHGTESVGMTFDEWTDWMYSDSSQPPRLEENLRQEMEGQSSIFDF